MNDEAKRLGILGGLFDPIHTGHIGISHFAMRRLNLEKVLFIPTYEPPHKEKFSSYDDRKNMVQLAIGDIPGFELSEVEKEIEGPSYSVNTLKKLHEIYPEYEIYFIIGSDNLGKMEEWHRPEKIFDLAHVVMANRPGDDRPEQSRFEERMIKIKMPPMDISSTEIRNMVREGKAIDKFVPPDVVKYIRTEGLYVR